MIKQKKHRVIFVSILAILTTILLISACDSFGFGDASEPPPPGPTKFGIVAPTDNAKVLVNSLVQIQSVHQNDISQVKLSVQAEGGEPKIIGVNIPTNGSVTQEWKTDTLGRFTIIVEPFINGAPQKAKTIQVEVTDNAAVRVNERAKQLAAGFEPQTPTPTISIVNVLPTEIKTTPGIAETTPSPTTPPVTPITVTPSPTSTPIPRYPPPPPIPGVPPGPTQKQMPAFGPPARDAAKIVGVFTSDNTRRVLITEPDDFPAKVVAGTTIFRAWRVQNVGTNTWGPGYELAFYGGRAMGSGGVAFESTFPGEPARRNTILDRNRLVVPEGKPNQTAVVEVMLNTPTIPGVHQSYWRMRNPHGVFFGPIMGVTMEVVRGCEFNVYGAPVINRFDILGVGNVYQPIDPAIVNAEFGENITLDWDIINASNFDIVIEDPTGEVESISTPDQRGRITFPVNELGEYLVTLYADNGSCTVTAQVKIFVFPPEDDQFRLIIIHSSDTANVSNAGASLQSSASVAAGDIQAQWNHFDENADAFVLLAALFEEKETEECFEVFGYKFPCYTTRKWVQVDSASVDVGGEGDAQGAATVQTLESNLCGALSGNDAIYEIQYRMRAGKDGRPANPEFSNIVVDNTRSCNYLRDFLPNEIEGAFNK